MFEMSSTVEEARRVAFALAKAEQGLGLHASASLPLSARLAHICYAAAENPAAIDPAAYSLAYRLSQQDTANVTHPDLKKQPGGPLHQPKQEPQKQ